MPKEKRKRKSWNPLTVFSSQKVMGAGNAWCHLSFVWRTREIQVFHAWWRLSDVQKTRHIQGAHDLRNLAVVWRLTVMFEWKIYNRWLMWKFHGLCGSPRPMSPWRCLLSLVGVTCLKNTRLGWSFLSLVDIGTVDACKHWFIFFLLVNLACPNKPYWQWTMYMSTNRLKHATSDTCRTL